MSNVLFAYPNTVDDCTLDGGLWTTGMPLTNLQDSVIKNWARSQSAHVGHTAFTFTYAAAALVGFIGLVAHNLSTAAQVRFRGYGLATPTLEMDFTGAVLDPRLSITRSTTGTFVGSNGLLQTAAINAARFEHDLTTLACRGLLVEHGATNRCLYASDIGNAAVWTKVTMTNAKTATGPDGVTNSATTLTASGAAATVLQQITIASSTWFSSVWIKRRTGTGIIKMTSNDVANWVDITSSVTTSWSRVTVPSQSVANPKVGLYIGTNGDAIDVALFQTEITCVTSAIETVASVVARTGDLVPATGASFSDWYNQTEGTFAAAFTPLGAPNSASGAVYSAGSDSTHYISATVNTVKSSRFDVVNSSSQASLGATTLTDNTLAYIASAYKVNDFASSLNAAAASTDVSGTLPTPTKLTIGHTNGDVASTMPMILSKLSYWPVRMSDANLAVISTSALNIAASYDSGWLDAIPPAYVAATTPAQRASLTQSTPHKLPTPQTYQYWRCDISDAANTDGYVQIGRLMVADTAFQPTYNASYGANIQWMDRAVISEADSGAEYAYDRPKYRVFKAALDWLTEAEGITKVLEMQRTLGTTGEVYAMWDPDDTTYLPNRSFLARMRSLNALETPLYGVWRTGFELKELL